MAKTKNQMSSTELVKRLTERFGTDANGLVPTVRKFMKEKQEAEKALKSG